MRLFISVQASWWQMECKVKGRGRVVSVRTDGWGCGGPVSTWFNGELVACREREDTGHYPAFTSGLFLPSIWPVASCSPVRKGCLEAPCTGLGVQGSIKGEIELDQREDSMRHQLLAPPHSLSQECEAGHLE